VGGRLHDELGGQLRHVPTVPFPRGPCRFPARESPPTKAAAILPIIGSEPAGPFGTRLRHWRQHRGFSQLTLAGKVGSTGRHISFLETGRSRPSRQMVLWLADALGVGLRESNEMLNAAGLPAPYPRADLDSTDLAPYRAAIDRMLHAHEPYPAIVIDGHWNVVLANRASAALFGAGVVGGNFVRDWLTNPAAAGAIVNWPEVAWAGLGRSGPAAPPPRPGTLRRRAAPPRRGRRNRPG